MTANQTGLSPTQQKELDRLNAMRDALVKHLAKMRETEVERGKQLLDHATKVHEEQVAHEERLLAGMSADDPRLTIAMNKREERVAQLRDQQERQASYLESQDAKRAEELAKHDGKRKVELAKVGINEALDAPEQSPGSRKNRNDSTRTAGGRTRKSNDQPKKSYAEAVADKVIEQLKQGTAPWQKPWAPGTRRGPYNPTTGKPYRGFNSIWLSCQGHDDGRWMTYKQAEAEGAQVRKGEKGTVIQFVQFRGQEAVVDDAGNPVVDADGKQKLQNVEYERPRVFGAVVFNASQIDNLPERLNPVAKLATWERHEKAEKIMANSNIAIRNIDGDRAYYNVGSDAITLPERRQFESADRYYATALHELGHATGHPSRLNRDLANPFGSEAYAREELRAEIASLMLGERLEIGHDPGQHVAYVGSWIKALQEDPREIMRASADAEKIAEMVQSWGRSKQATDELEQKRVEQRAAHEMTAEEFKQQAYAESSEPGKWQVVLADRSASYVNADTKDAAVAIAHRRAVDTAIHQNREGRGILESVGATVPTMPSAAVLADYPDLAKAAAQQQPPVLTEASTMTDRAQPGRQYLAVPYREKEEAKSAGAKWDKENKAWYAGDGADMEALKRWLPSERPTVAQDRDSPEEQFRKALKDCGLVLDAKTHPSGLPFMDGQKRRVACVGDEKNEKSGMYVGFSDGHPAGYIHNFKTMGEIGVNWKASGTAESLTDADRTRLMAEAAERLAQREKDRRTIQEAAADRIAAEIAGGVYKPADPTHGYLARKGLAHESKGLLQDSRGHLIVPVHDADGKVWNLQKIGHGGWKGFENGAALIGHFHTIAAAPSQDDGAQSISATRPGALTPAVVVEGWATGKSINRATGAEVHVAFSKSNLEGVARGIREREPNRPILVAGDNDHEKENDLDQTGRVRGNPGKEYAQRAAAAVGGYAAIPSFDEGSKGSDWNDFEVEKGTAALRKAMDESLLLADRRMLADAHRLGHDAERVTETVRLHQANAEANEAEAGATFTNAGSADMRSGLAALRNAAEREGDRQDKSDELYNGEPPPKVAEDAPDQLETEPVKKVTTIRRGHARRQTR